MRILTHTKADAIQYKKGWFSSRKFIVNTPHGAIKGDHLLMATGRPPNTESLALNKVGIKTDRSGAIQVNERM